MRLLFLPLLLSACLPTNTGNPPLQGDASPSADTGPGYDAGGGFADAAASDAGPASDGGPAFDSSAVSDASPGADAMAPDASACTDAGPSQCGITGAATCDCLADESVTLGEGRPLLLVDQEALNGNLTLVRRRQAAEGGTTIEALVVVDDAIESVTELARDVQQVAASKGDAISVVATIGEREIRHFEVDVETGISEPPVTYTFLRRVGNIDVARSGSTAAIAFSGPASDEPSDGNSVFVIRADGGVFDAEPVQLIRARNIRALTIEAAPDGWLLAIATDESLFTMLLDEAGEAVAAAQEITPGGFHLQLELVARDDGFLLAYDGARPSVHVLDASGASVAEQAVAGRVLALEWSDLGFAMMLRSDILSCASVASPLVFERFQPDFTPLHDPVQVGFADYAAAVAMRDGHPWVANSTGADLNLVDACLDMDL